MKEISLINENIGAYAYHNSKPEDILLQELIQETIMSIGHEKMISDRLVCNLLKILIYSSKTKNILEIGTFTGYSALNMAEALPDDGKLITCEINLEAIKIAEKYFNRSPHGKKIQIKMGPALETLCHLSDQFDFVFIDADKINYLQYYQYAKKLLKPRGIIVLDNVLWSGKVLNPEDESSKAIVETNEFILNDASVQNVILTVRDGLNIVFIN